MTIPQQLLDSYTEISVAPVQYEVPVLWGDMDSAQHVNNLVYMRWTETSRIKLFAMIDDISFDGDQGVILAWQDMKYIFPMTYPDTAIITARISKIKEDRFFVESKIYSLRHKRIAAISSQSIVPYDYHNFTKVPLTGPWKEKMEKLVGI